MAAKATLRAVVDGEKAPPKSITEAASRGSHRELLVAMRDRIALALEDEKCPPRDLASLTLRLGKIAEEIKALDVSNEQEAQRGDTVTDEAFDSAAI